MKVVPHDVPPGGIRLLIPQNRASFRITKSRDWMTTPFLTSVPKFSCGTNLTWPLSHMSPLFQRRNPMHG